MKNAGKTATAVSEKNVQEIAAPQVAPKKPVLDTVKISNWKKDVIDYGSAIKTASKSIGGCVVFMLKNAEALEQIRVLPDIKTFPTAMIRPSGANCASGSPRFSGSEAKPSGPNCSTEPKRAWHRLCRSQKPKSTRTSRREAPTWITKVYAKRPLRRGFRQPPPPWESRRARPAQTPKTCSPTGASAMLTH